MALKVNIKDFGVVEGSEKLQTKMIQKAIDYCFEQGGGEIIVPEGTYHTGDIRLRSNTTLHLMKNAMLVGSINPEDYFNYLNDEVEPIPEEWICNNPFVHVRGIDSGVSFEQKEEEQRFKRVPCSRWNNALIRAIGADNVKIIGESGSVIDGSNCFDDKGSEENYRGPHGITFVNCSNITFRGYTIQNTANWAHNIRVCKNISVEGVTVCGGHDGIDVFTCTNVSILNCKFYTGDDCVAGFGNVNVHISDCVLNSSCSAMRFGGSNVLVEKCKIYGPGEYCFRGSMTRAELMAMMPSVTDGMRNNMLSAITYYADYSMPIRTQQGNIVIENCEIENTDRFLHYNFSGNEIWQQLFPLKNIEFRNIKAKNVSMPITVYGEENVKVDVTLSNVDIKLKSGCENIDLIQACNYGRITLENLRLENFAGEAVVRSWSDGKVEVHNLSGVDKDAIVQKATKDFFSAAI